jgi:hypothetical protein
MREKVVAIVVNVTAILMILISLLKIAQGEYDGLNPLWFLLLYVVAFKPINRFLRQRWLTLILVVLALGLQMLMLILSKVI